MVKSSILQNALDSPSDFQLAEAKWFAAGMKEQLGDEGSAESNRAH